MTNELSSSTIAEEPLPASCILQGDDIQALAIKVEDLEKVCTFTARNRYLN